MEPASVGSPGNSELEAERIDAHRKIKVGQGISSLCGRCTYSQIIRRRAKNDPEIWCHCFEPERKMTEDIIECSRFKNEGTLGVWELAQLAKVIDNRDLPIGDYR